MKFLTLSDNPIPARFSVDGYTYDIQVPRTTADGTIYMPSHFLVYCGICGDVWAKREIITEQQMRWWAREMPCVKCGHGFLWNDSDDAWNKSFNIHLWERELDLIHMYHIGGAATAAALFPPKNFRRRGYGPTS